MTEPASVSTPASVSAPASVSTDVSITVVASERMLKLFAYHHLPGFLQAHSKPFFDLAVHIAVTIPAGPERTVALRKLLEAKDAAVRAVAIPEPAAT